MFQTHLLSLVALSLALALLIMPATGSAPTAAEDASKSTSAQTRGLAGPAPSLPAAQSATQPAPDIELLGQLGGPVETLTVRGSDTYAGIGHRLTILDVSNPAQPVAVGESPTLPAVVRGVAVAGGYAYVATGDGGLFVVDLANPARPTIGATYTAGSALGVVVAGTRAYVAGGAGGLRILDVTNPLTPTELGVYQTTGTATHVAVAGGYAYVTTGAWSTDEPTGLGIIDVSNPVSPTQRSFFGTPSFASGLVVSGTVAFIAETSYANSGGGLRLVDIADPSRPRQLALYNNTGFVYLYGVAVSGGYAYATANNQGLRVIDVRDPTNPFDVGSARLRDACAVAVSGDRAYVGTLEDGLHVLDVSNPSQPTEIGLSGWAGVVNGVAVGGRYAYYVSGSYTGERGLRVVDVADPTRPTRVGQLDLPEIARGVTVSGTVAYVADGSAGLYLVDVSSPTRPAVLGRYQTSGYVVGVVLAGRYAYVADSSQGVHIIDVADPANPIAVGLYEVHLSPGETFPPVSASSAAVAGNYLYVAVAAGALAVVDVSSPQSPRQVAFYNIPDYAWGVATDGSHVYVTGGGGLRVFDAADPSRPVQVGFLAMNGSTVVAAGDYVYVGGAATLQVVDVRNPARPALVGSFSAFRFFGGSGSDNDIAVAGHYAYLAGYSSGLFVLWLGMPAQTAIGTAGGALTSAVDRTSYVLPPGTFTATVTLKHTGVYDDDPPPPGLRGIGRTFEMAAVYSDTGQLAQPAPGSRYTITVGFGDGDRGLLVAGTRALYWWDGSRWVKEPTSTVDPTTGTVTATPNHFSRFAIFGESRRLFFPIVARSR